MPRKFLGAAEATHELRKDIPCTSLPGSVKSSTCGAHPCSSLSDPKSEPRRKQLAAIKPVQILSCRQPSRTRLPNLSLRPPRDDEYPAVRSKNMPNHLPPLASSPVSSISTNAVLRHPVTHAGVFQPETARASSKRRPDSFRAIGDPIPGLRTSGMAGCLWT